MGRRSSLVRFALGTMVTVGFVASVAQAQWRYSYFKENVSLTLDVERIAVFRSRPTSEHGKARLLGGPRVWVSSR